MIADVTGKGIPAAVLMADVKALLHAATDNTEAPAEALRRVNAVLVRERAASLFVTAALLDRRGGDGRRAVRARPGTSRRSSWRRRIGSRRAARGRRARSWGPSATPTFEEGATSLEPGDAVTLYTDGVTESRDPRRAGSTGRSGCSSSAGGACGRPAGRPAEAIARALIDEVTAFRGEAEPFDDLTLLVAERRPV